VREKIRHFEEIGQTTDTGAGASLQIGDPRDVTTQRPLAPAAQKPSQRQSSMRRKPSGHSFSIKDHWRIRISRNQNDAPRHVSKSKIPIFKGASHSRPGTVSPSYHDAPRQTRSFSWREALRKISNPKSRSREKDSTSPGPRTRPSSASKNVSTPSENPTHICARSGLPLPVRTPYPIHDSCDKHNVDTASVRKPSTLTKPPPLKSGNQAPRTAPRHDCGYGNSFGRYTLTRTGSVAQPVLSTAHGSADTVLSTTSNCASSHLASTVGQSKVQQAMDSKHKEGGANSNSDGTKTWGRRAATAAAELGRRLPASFKTQARKVSGSLRVASRGRRDVAAVAPDSSSTAAGNERLPLNDKPNGATTEKPADETAKKTAPPPPPKKPQSLLILHKIRPPRAARPTTPPQAESQPRRD
jgi:hypothetical protein